MMMFARSHRISRMALAITTAIIAPVAWAQHPQAQSQQLNAQNADIRAFIQEVSRLTSRTFIIDPQVQGSVMIASGGAMNDDQLYEVFLTTLRANGYIVTPTASGAYRVGPAADAATLAQGAGAERFVTQVIRLKSRDAGSVVPVIQPLVGRGGQVTAATRANAIVITDFADNVRRLSTLVADLDRDTDTIEIVALKNSRPSALVASLREIVGATGDATAAAATFTAVDTSGSLVIRGPAETVSRLSRIAATLDEQARPTGATRVYFLHHADAADMAELLQGIVSQPAERTTSSAAPGGPAQSPAMPMQGEQRGHVAVYPGANAVVVRADPTVQQEVDAIVRALDRRGEQVLVQAIVVEISDTAARNLGVQFLLSGKDNGELPFFATSYENARPNILALGGALASGLPDDSPVLEGLQDAAINALLGSTGAIGGIASNLNGDGTFGMVLNAIKRDSGSNLLSTPSILTLNNREATILVGQDVPITTGEVLSSGNDNPFRTVQRQEIGVSLTVTPQINADGSITMSIKQGVSSINGPITASFGDFIFNKRNIETTVLADNGEIIVLGGLLDEGEQVSTEKVPLLGDLPLVGGLFRSDARERVQTNLVVFIRPVVVRSKEDTRHVTLPSFDRMQQLQRNVAPDGRSSLETIMADPGVIAPQTQSLPRAAQPADEAE